MRIFHDDVYAMAATVFISHISEESEFALALQRCILDDFNDRIEVFVSSDVTSIQAGAQWLPAIEEALRRTDLMLVLCTRESVERPWILFEAGAAWTKGIPIIPICYAGMTPEQLPLPLGYLHAANMHDGRGLVRLYKSLGEVTNYTPTDHAAELSHARIVAVADAVIASRENEVVERARRNLAGWLYIALGPFVVSGVYGLSLITTGGNLEIGGGILSLAGVVVAFVAGCLYQLTQDDYDAATLVLASVAFAVLTGVISTTLYFGLGQDPDAGFFGKKLLDIVAFIVYVGASLLAGTAVGDRLRQNPEHLSVVSRFIRWNRKKS